MVLVTGATGFVGGNVARRLADDNWKVRALVRTTTSLPVVSLEHPNITCVVGDIIQPTTLMTACANVAVIFHAAADTRLRRWQQAWQTNVTGTQMVYEAGRNAGIHRFIFTSTFDVYLGLARYQDEDTPLLPYGDVYGDSKIAAETFLRSQPPPPEVVILRLPPVYGPGSREWTVNPLRDAQAHRLFLPDGGRAPFPYLYIENLADAVAAVVAAPQAHGVYNVLDGRTTYTSFFNFFARLSGNSVRSIPYWLLYSLAFGADVYTRLTRRWTALSRRRVRAVFGGQRSGWPGADCFQRDFGWMPRVDLVEGQRRSETWLRQNGFLAAHNRSAAD
ncbi:MAG: hypothetical protein Fur0021_20620 [Candidatus Promineifilaceae bacterium]